ncbi:MAG: type IV pilus assembly protein PilM [Pseudomonadota bacterium]
MKLPGQKKPVVGLDIGSHTIKAIVLDRGKSGLIMRNMGVVQLPPEAVVEGAVQEKQIIIGAIKNLIKSLKIKVKNVSTSISGYSVIIKKITLPLATRQELAGNIEVEAEQFIPFDISEVNVDFQILGRNDRQEDQMDVILVAAKKEVIDVYMEILVEANLKPTIVDVDVFALENAFTQNYPDISGAVALIDIGANKMNINVVKDGISLLTKDAAMGGARVTNDIQDRFEIDFDTAEAIKLGGIEPEDPAAVKEIVSLAVENWVAEAKRTVDFLESSYPGERLRAIYMSGGSSRISGLYEFFEKELGVPVRQLNPFLTVGTDPKKFDPSYVEYMAPQSAICLGLALRWGEEI